MSSAKKIVLKKNKELDTIWHPETTLVFKSSTEKVVTGRYENGEFISLDEKALELCEKWKFKYDTSLIEEEEEEEGDEEEGEEEDGEADEQAVDDEQPDQDVEEQEEDNSDPVVVPVVQQVILPSTGNTTKEVNSIMIDANTRLNSYLTSLVSEFTSKIDKLETQLSSKSSELVDTKKKLDENVSKLNDLSSQHVKLQAKFDGIKQLFS